MMESLRLLYISEESSLFAETGRRLREQDDLEVDCVSGDEAASRLEEAEFDAVICGVNLESELDGLDVLAAVRRSDPLIPFFFYTSEDSPQLIARAFQEGANDYFVVEERPQQLVEIVEAVRVNVDLARLLREQQRGRMRSPFEEKYAGLFEELEEGSLMVDAEKGTISFVNDSLAQSLGYKAQDLVDTPLDDYLSTSFGSTGQLNTSELVARLKGGETILEVGLKSAEGITLQFWAQARLLELSGATVMLWQCRDITRFERLEREVIAVRNQLRTIVENSADAIILAQADGTIEFFGGAGPQLFGISPEEATGRTIGDLFGAQAETVKQMMDRIGDRQRVTGMESSIVSRWGTRVPVSVAITVLPSSDGVTRHLFNILDITAQKVGEAEKMLSAELIRTVSGGAGPVEALPKLIERVRGTVPINYGLLVGVDAERDALSVVALFYDDAKGSGLKVGQSLGAEHLPAEEELWLRDGIIRNDLKPEGLPPLEKLLYSEGVRSYVSVPLRDGGTLIGGAHFGSHRPYALNRGHLVLFMDLAGALAGVLVRARSSGEAQRYRLLTAVLVEEVSGTFLICDPEGTILEANEEAVKVIGADTELRGRTVSAVLRSFCPRLVPDISWLQKNAGTQRPCTARDGSRWMIGIAEVGSRDAPAGYTIRLQQA